MSNIRIIIVDVDGTLTDGSIYYGNDGSEIKRFNVKDGLIMQAAQKMGVSFCILTGRKSAIVERRMKELHVEYVFQGVGDKKEFLLNFFASNNLNICEAAYIGDDLNDLAAMLLCDFKACPQDASEDIKAVVDYVSSYKGGQGAVRDIVEYILKRQGVWNEVVNVYEVN